MNNAKPIHVYPVNDLKPHELEGEPCWCNPQINTGEFDPIRHTYTLYDAPIVIHNSADGREYSEEALRMIRADQRRFIDPEPPEQTGV